MGTRRSCAHQPTRSPTSLPVLLSLEHRPCCAAISNCQGRARALSGGVSSAGGPALGSSILGAGAPISAHSCSQPSSPKPCLCPRSVALTVRVGLRSQQAQCCHATGLAPTAQQGVQSHGRLLGAHPCCGQEIAFCISRQLPPAAKGRERAARARRGFAQPPLLTLQHHAAGQHCLMGRAGLRGHI